MPNFKRIATSLMLIFLIIGCQRGADQVHQGPVIALVLKTLNNPYFIDMQSGAEEEAKNQHVNLIVQAAEREVDVEKQMQIIENLIQTKVDVICVTPSGSMEIIPAIVKANKAKIPIIVLDTRVDTTTLKKAGGQIAMFIGSDNFEGGRIAGQYITKKMNGKGKVAILEGIPGHETGDERLRGFHLVVDAYPNIDIVSSQTANWERDQGFNVFQNMLQSYPDIQALFACNDIMALGAIEAIEAAGKTNEITVIGFDATTDARQAILQGTMDGSIAQYSGEMGKLAVKYAVELLDNKKIPAFVPVRIELITKKELQKTAK